MTGIPDGYHTITPHIATSDAEGAITHYTEALGAELLIKVAMPDTGKIMHSCLQIGTSKIFLCDEFETIKAPGDGVGGAHFYLLVEDVDAAHKRAVDAGMTETMAPEDMFWGDRMSGLTDRFGHHWNIATNIREVSQEELDAAMKNMNC